VRSSYDVVRHYSLTVDNRIQRCKMCSGTVNVSERDLLVSCENRKCLTSSQTR
jgi:hypothetical protein